MVSPEPMVIGVEEIIPSHVVNNLHEDNSLNNFAEDAQYSYRSIVLC